MPRHPTPSEKGDSEAPTLWLDEYLPYRAAVASSEIGKVISPFYRQFGLTMPELAILSVLFEESPLTQQMIIARTVMEKYAISRAARDLIKRGLVERADHEVDGRSYWLSISPAGRQCYESVVPMSLAFEEELREALGGEEMYRTVKEVLRQLETAAKSLPKRRS